MVIADHFLNTPRQGYAPDLPQTTSESLRFLCFDSNPFRYLPITAPETWGASSDTWMMGALFQSASVPMDRDEVIQKLQWELLQKAGCHFFNCLNYFKLL